MKKNRIWTWLAPVLIILYVFAGIACWKAGFLEVKRTKVLLIGLDAVDWEILNPLIGQDRVPNIERLVNEGTSGVLLSRNETSSPIIWTTIATGRLRRDHGIRGFFRAQTDLDPWEVTTPIPVTSADRQVPALWNIVSMYSRRVACLGWWATWPAEEVNGAMVSGFTAYDPNSLVRRGVHAGEDIENLTWPRDLNETISPYLLDVDDVSRESIDRFFEIDDWNHEVFEHEAIKQAVDYVIPWTYTTDTSYFNVAKYLMDDEDFDLFMVFFQGTDTTSHRFWEFRPGNNRLSSILRRYNLQPELIGTYRQYFGDTMNRYYEYADEMVGELLEEIDDDTVVIICSDHGFAEYNKPTRTGPTTLFSGSHRLEGSIILWGPGIKERVKLDFDDPPSILDVTPTILALLNLPIANDMPGRPIMEAFTDEFIENFEEKKVETYNGNYSPGEAPEIIPMDEEYEERLRSLGYIQ